MEQPVVAHNSNPANAGPAMKDIATAVVVCNPGMKIVCDKYKVAKFPTVIMINGAAKRQIPPPPPGAPLKHVVFTKPASPAVIASDAMAQAMSLM